MGLPNPPLKSRVAVATAETLVKSHEDLASLVKIALEQIPFPPGFSQDLTVHIRDAQITSVQCQGITRFSKDQ